MDAMLCRDETCTPSDLDAADAWYRGKAPREPTPLGTSCGATSISPRPWCGAGGQQAGHGAADACPLEPYVQNCARIIDGIHPEMSWLPCTLYRKKDERWRERLTAALDAAAQYRFIAPISVAARRCCRCWRCAGLGRGDEHGARKSG